jgi:hypothetical protein
MTEGMLSLYKRQVRESLGYWLYEAECPSPIPSPLFGAGILSIALRVREQRAKDLSANQLTAQSG